MAIRTANNGTVQIAFETFGAAGGWPLLLVMGLDSPMQWWPDGFCAALAERGFHVARFDGRDCGKSTRYRGWRNAARPSRLPRLAWRSPAYTAADMVGDGIAVMDALGWSSAHVVGASLGAGLTRGMAIRHPERVRTIVSIMGLPAAFTPAATVRYVNLPGFVRFVRSGTRTSHSAWEDMNVQVETARMLASAGHPFDEQWAYAAAAACRSGAPGDPGTARRQLAAVWADEGLLQRAAEITAPLLVLHGADDPLFKPAAAVALTKQVPGSKCVIYPDMGHEIPKHLWAQIADDIDRHAQTREQPHGRRQEHGSIRNGDGNSNREGAAKQPKANEPAARPSTRPAAEPSRRTVMRTDRPFASGPVRSHSSGRVPD